MLLQNGQPSQYTTKWSRVQETILKSMMMPNESSKGVWSFDALGGFLILLPILYTWTVIPCTSLYWFLVWPVDFLLILSIHIHSVVVSRCPIQFVGDIRTSNYVLASQWHGPGKLIHATKWFYDIPSKLATTFIKANSFYTMDVLSKDHIS